MQQLSIDIFLERVADMPDVEALEQIELRLDSHALELAVLQRAIPDEKGKQRARISAEMAAMCLDRSRLNAARREINVRRMRYWYPMAIRAVFGDEGYARCREWMEAMQCRS